MERWHRYISAGKVKEKGNFFPGPPSDRVKAEMIQKGAKPMKKMFAMLLALVLLAGTAMAEDGDFRSMTGLDALQAKLEEGVTIDRVYYTDGYGFSTSEFGTEDPEVIALLLEALDRITVAGRVDESITDWYPQIVFYLSDGTNAGVRFEAHWLCVGGRENYELEGAEAFWNLTAALVRLNAGEDAE